MKKTHENMKLFLHSNVIEMFIANGILLSNDIGDYIFRKHPMMIEESSQNMVY